MVVWLHIYDSKCVVRIYGIATKCVICGVDIHPDIDYTCHDDSSLYVVSLVTLGALLKYGRLIHALQVQGSFHIVLPFEGPAVGRRSGKPVGHSGPMGFLASFPAVRQPVRKSSAFGIRAARQARLVCRIGSRRVREREVPPLLWSSPHIVFCRICPRRPQLRAHPPAALNAQSRCVERIQIMRTIFPIWGSGCANLLFS